MGSWYGTCALSQLPILPNERVVIFPLMKNEYSKTGGAGFVYPTDQYMPISLPLFGEYDDYGGAENLTKNSELVLKHLQLSQEYGFIHSKGNDDKTPMDANKLVNEFLKKRGYVNTGFMLVHDEIYHAVINEMGNRIPYKKEKNVRTLFLEEATNFLTQLHEIKRDLPELEKRLETLREKREESKEDFMERMNLFKKVNLFKYGFAKEAFPVNAMVRYFGEYQAQSLHMKTLLETLIRSDETTQKTMIEEIVDFILFDMAMEESRKLYSPQAGSGSQSREYVLQKVIAEQIIKKEQAMFDQWVEENETTEEQRRKIREKINKETIYFR